MTLEKNAANVALFEQVISSVAPFTSCQIEERISGQNGALVVRTEFKLVVLDGYTLTGPLPNSALPQGAGALHGTIQLSLEYGAMQQQVQ